MPDLKRTHEADVLLLYVILLNADSETINWPAVAEAAGITQSAARLKWYRLKQELDLKIQAGGFDYKESRVAEAQSGGEKDAEREGSSMKAISAAATAATAATAAGEEEPCSDGKPKEQEQSQLNKETKRKSSEIVQDLEYVLFPDLSSAGSDGDDDEVDGTRGGRRKSFVLYTGDRGEDSGETKRNTVVVLESKRRELERRIASQERVSCRSAHLSALVEVAAWFDDQLGEDFAFYSDEEDRGNGEVKEGGKAGDCAATQEDGTDQVKEGAVE